MNIKNSTINFLGDSITEGVGASKIENRFTDVLAREYGLKAANNYGIGGSRIARQIVITSEAYDRDFCMRYKEMDKNADAVVVFGGTNDYGHGEAPLGVPEDRTPDTFWGACHYLFNGLLEMYSGKPILILTPLHRLDENNPLGDGSKPRSAATLKTYKDIIVNVAEHYGLPVLNLYATSGIQPLNETNRKLLLPDGLHPSDMGHALIARRIANTLMLL
ncbi:SGNH/GDSL hydrolase family protein [Anaerococcus sp.]|uniref:SGNH/GDSL hydrolase family protein n=1 Tax=Anaerococcus sp. TaxID=1872515 RepID=UPI002A909DD6|nr:SGNH/GDSL hydrolase family protein [Anaerococcus sp.]MDY6127523.1 SGNH/GDSL hydrolase family protein [Anaerococcus sp.]